MHSNVLNIYSLIKPKSIWAELPVLLGFNVLLIASSYLVINLPFSPVPITAQTFAVLFIAMTLGRVRGSAVVLAYLLEGIAGVPVFAGGAFGFSVIMGTTGGYLIGFLIAAYLVGYLADIGFDRTYTKSLIAMTLGTAVIFFFGLLGLSRFGFAESLGALLAIGFTPYLPGAIVKIALASVLLPSIWKKIESKTD